MPITSKQVNEASGNSEANVARDRTARTGGTARPGAKPAKSYQKKEGQPDPTKSVEEAGGPSSKPESKSDKTWSRSGDKNQQERARR